MQEILALSLQAMHRDMQRLDRIAGNLANATTPGFQRDIVSRQAVSSEGLTFAGWVDQHKAVGAPSELGIPRGERVSTGVLIHRDSRPGTLKYTGQSLDVALAGPGYFEVMTPSGPAYTRQGNFQMDARGRLVTAAGFPVMGKGGEIVLTEPSPSIDAAGRLYAPHEHGQGHGSPILLGQLKVVQPEDGAQMQRQGHGLMTSSMPLAEVPEAQLQIRQGYTENSNVSAMHEMVQLVETMRHFESMQKVALGYDEMTAQAIRKLGDLS